MAVAGLVLRAVNAQPRVQGGHVVRVAVILVDQLPVTFDIEVQRLSVSKRGEVVLAGPVGKRSKVLLEVDRIACEVDKNQVMPEGVTHRDQTRRIRPWLSVVLVATKKSVAVISACHQMRTTRRGRDR